MSISHVDDGQLHAYLDGELPQAEAWRLEAHLGECPACRGRLEEQRALIARASELLALAAPPARTSPPGPLSTSWKAGAEVRPPSQPSWRGPVPLAWAASVVLALAAGWYLRGESPSSPVPPDRRAAAANAAAPRETARTVPPVPPSPRQTAETKTLAQHDQMISGSAVPNPQITPLDQAARAKAAPPAPAPAAALAAPAAPLAARWETIPWDTARAILGVEPVRIPSVPVIVKRSSPGDSVVLIEQRLESGTVIRLYERLAAEAAPGANEPAAALGRVEVRGVLAQRLDASERLARYVGNLRVEIEGALPADSLSKLLELVR